MTGMKMGARRARQIMNVIREGAEQGWSEARLVREIRLMVPLLPKQQTAITTYRRKLKADGVPPAKAAQLVEKYGKRLREQRATTIVRTESTRLAVNEYRSQNEGKTLVWVAKPDACPLCKALHGMEHKDYSGTYRQPPAHPNCRCEERVKSTRSK